MPIREILKRDTDKRFKHLLGKKVEFQYNGETRTGILEFAGINHLCHHKFQVTTNRTPHWPVNPNTIKEVK